MTIYIVPRGYMSKYLNGQSKVTLEMPENATILDALLKAGIVPNECEGYAFSAIHGTKVKEDHILADGDTITVFSVAHGG